MKILVINLDSDTPRLKFQHAQMNRLSLKFERLPATEIADIDTKILTEKSAQWERPMRASELACLFSHRAAWQRVVRESAPMLILEDDALLSSNVPEILKQLEKSSGHDHISLEIRSRKKLLGMQPVKITDTADLLRLYQDRTGAAAYILWPRGANILLEISDNASGLADAIIAAAYQMSSWQIEPAAAMQLDQCKKYEFLPPLETESTIDEINKPAPDSLMTYVKFRFRRITAQLRMGLRRLSTVTKARYRYVAVEIEDFDVHISQ